MTVFVSNSVQNHEMCVATQQPFPVEGLFVTCCVWVALSTHPFCCRQELKKRPEGPKVGKEI